MDIMYAVNYICVLYYTFYVTDVLRFHLYYLYDATTFQMIIYGPGYIFKKCALNNING